MPISFLNVIRKQAILKTLQKRLQKNGGRLTTKQGKNTQTKPKKIKIDTNPILRW